MVVWFKVLNADNETMFDKNLISSALRLGCTSNTAASAVKIKIFHADLDRNEAH